MPKEKKEKKRGGYNPLSGQKAEKKGEQNGNKKIDRKEKLAKQMIEKKNEELKKKKKGYSLVII